jgi:hypothetical protein
MASHKLQPQNEMTGTSLGDPNLGRKAKWAGANMGPDIIAAVSRGRQYDNPDSGRSNQGAPKRAGTPTAMVKKMDPSGVPTRPGYGGYRCS